MQSQLLDQADELRGRMRVKDPLDRIVITLSAAPRDWRAVQAEIKGLD